MKILVFEQDNCGWCVRLHPHIKKLAEDFAFQLEFINITDKWELAEQYKFRTTPTVIAVSDETILKRWSIKPDKGIAGLIEEIKEYVQHEYMW